MCKSRSPIQLTTYISYSVCKSTTLLQTDRCRVITLETDWSLIHTIHRIGSIIQQWQRAVCIIALVVENSRELTTEHIKTVKVHIGKALNDTGGHIKKQKQCNYSISQWHCKGTFTEMEMDKRIRAQNQWWVVRVWGNSNYIW